MGRGRSPKLSEDELVEAIESVTSPEWPVADTVEVLEALEDAPTKRTVRDTLRNYSGDSESRIRGRKPGNQKGWVWWTHPAESDK